jgi:hypothetical protein
VVRISITLSVDLRVHVDCESLLGLGCDSLLASGADHRGRVRLSPSAHIHPVGSVAVLLNLDTMPVHLRTTPIQTADPTRRGILRTFVILDADGIGVM